MVTVESPVRIDGSKRVVRRVRTTRPMVEAISPRLVAAPRRVQRKAKQKGMWLSDVGRAMALGALVAILAYPANGLLGGYALNRSQRDVITVQSELGKARQANQQLQTIVDQMSAPRQIAEWARSNQMTRVGSMVALSPGSEAPAERTQQFAMVTGP